MSALEELEVPEEVFTESSVRWLDEVAPALLLLATGSQADVEEAPPASQDARIIAKSAVANKACLRFLFIKNPPCLS